MTTRQVQAVVQIREMILRGELAPGERLGEEALAATLGMSRTPIRQALPALAREGLLVMGETRGYVVRAFGEKDVCDAIEMRGLLEGMAGRRIAERGASAALLRDLRDCLATGDAMLAALDFAQGEAVRFAEMNARFHLLIAQAADSKVLLDALAANDRIPFAAAGAVAFDRMPVSLMVDLLKFAHRQHHAIVQAIETRQGARVEALLREHACAVKDSLNLHNRDATEHRFAGPTPENRAMALRSAAGPAAGSSVEHWKSVER